ncbi:amidohydrolase [Aliiglaciecola sp. CAU 1673]|uniref:amidohydrolase n=1 Tax=Aliiglaciecola sp. CAU 1673 TaxID=3032595 RepID=UPI0023DA1BAB|nr:amidohydrolase [Aliiglaciecola sp. CAU 1673]MDF2176820.1 amidohydrolase [Aliiglaciecola sp. CAU 1673]
MKRLTIRFISLFSLVTSITLSAAPTLIENVQGYHILPDKGLVTFSALAFEDGKVLATGDASLLAKYPDAKRIDGQGKTLLPGLIDAHGHLLGLGDNLLQVELREAKSAKDAVAKVAEYAKANPDLPWIVGRGWNQVLWPGKQFPTAAQIDTLIADKPVWLERVDGHAAWVNSKALALAGIDKNTKDPAGGQIVRDAQGNATGVLIDNAMPLVGKHLPKIDDAARARALKAATGHLLSLGITSMHDAGIDHETYHFYLDQAKANALGVRIYAMISAADPILDKMLEKGHQHLQDDRLWIQSVKAFGDGALGSRGAALLAPYSDDKDNRGLLVTAEKDLAPLFEKVLGAGFQLNYHAIGDRANRLAMDNFSAAYKKVGGRELRNRVEHAQIVSPEDIPRFKTLDIIASMQPVHATSDMNMAGDRLGEERLQGAYAWQSFLKQGTVVAAGSDFPVELANPFHGLYSAVTRQNHAGEPPGGWLPEEKLTLEQAFRAFTLDAAYAAHQENILGNLEAGKWADFILIDRDIFNIDASTLWQTQVLQTWLAGESVFQH